MRAAGAERGRAAVSGRSGAAYGPAIVVASLAYFDDLLAEAKAESPWEAVLSREPEPHPWVPDARLDTILEAFADFVDSKCPYTAGHSRGVAALAGASLPAEAPTLRRAGLV